MGERLERLFLAIPLEEETRHRIAHLLSSSAGPPLPGRLVRPENWHLTLRFLGDIEQVSRELVMAAIDQSDLGGGFAVRFGQLGAFPRPGRATVLWLGLDRGAAEAARLAETIESAVVSAGMPSEDRPFRPHLTLSRIRPPVDVVAWLDAVDPLEVSMTVDRVVLYRSHLGHGGARYTEAEEFLLA